MGFRFGALSSRHWRSSLGRSDGFSADGERRDAILKLIDFSAGTFTKGGRNGDHD